MANAAIVPAGTSGAISVYVTNPTHVILSAGESLAGDHDYGRGAYTELAGVKFGRKTGRCACWALTTAKEKIVLVGDGKE